MVKRYYFYITTNKYNKVFYIGVTNNIARRIWEHKSKVNLKSFTYKYNVDKLIYCEIYPTFMDAVSREKQVKGWLRRRKIELIKEANPKFEEIIPE